MLDDIKRIIENAYDVRGEQKICKKSDITLNGEKVKVMLNSEDPYIGVEFFRLIDEVVNEVKKLGYSKKEAGFCMNYYIIHFKPLKK